MQHSLYYYDTNICGLAKDNHKVTSITKTNQKIIDYLWTRDHINYFISLLEKCECLYSPVHPYYLNETKMMEQYKFIMDGMKNIRPNITINEIRDKIRALSLQVLQENSKIALARANGEIYTPKMWCYNQLTFLLRCSWENHEISNINIAKKIDNPRPPRESTSRGSDDPNPPIESITTESDDPKPSLENSSIESVDLKPPLENISKENDYPKPKLQMHKIQARSLWSREQTMAFLIMLKKYPLIYNSQHPDFIDLKKKIPMYMNLISEMSDIKPDITTEQIRTKLATLVLQMRKENIYKRNAIKCGKIYTPKLWCYNEAKSLCNGGKVNNNIQAGGIWSKAQTLALLSRLKKYPIIYNPKHPDFIDVKEKKLKYMSLISELSDIKPDVTISQIRNKKRILLTQIRRENIYKNNSIERGRTYTPTLWCYNEAKFLCDRSEVDNDGTISPVTITSDDDKSEESGDKIQAGALWSREQTEALLTILKKYPIIYNPKHPDFIHLKKKKQKYMSVVAELSDMKPDVTIAQIRKKIKTLITQIRRDNIHRLNAIRRGMTYTPKLWCYNESKFLCDREEVDNRRTKSRPVTTTLDDDKNEESGEKGYNQVSLLSDELTKSNQTSQDVIPDTQSAQESMQKEEIMLDDSMDSEEMIIRQDLGLNENTILSQKSANSQEMVPRQESASSQDTTSSHINYLNQNLSVRQESMVGLQVIPRQELILPNPVLKQKSHTPMLQITSIQSLSPKIRVKTVEKLNNDRTGESLNNDSVTEKERFSPYKQLSHSTDKFSHFGESIAAQLREMDLCRALDAMAELQAVLSRRRIEDIRSKHS